MTALQIIVTGANGQLGMEFKDLSKSSDHDFTFLSSSDLDISSRSQVIDYFKDHKVDVILNCAAYTKVDLAETEKTKAYDVNANGVKNLLEAMSDQCLMLHYSTDYVYNAELGTAIKENEATYPSNVYAASKLSGDQHVIKSNKKAIVLRTSWVYSSYGNNFVKTMLRLADKLPEIKVVNDQIGAPTFAKDLASVSMSILNTMLSSEDISFFNKVYHYSNSGQISWYDFAKEIFAQADKDILLYPIPTSEYPTPANRPFWSVLDCNLIQETFGIEVLDWKKSLAVCLEKLG
ncbi:MAG TPA: dTDP-4-dehydrorhamnose reductase [Saprospirales bacterium]|mgnify:FL=1|jgi:dTDP-4-dehydrorhamnose reductase|nr:dTDP-4-dehydrorhamnose reductase [Saprospiraceae bacterium]HAV29002.1 dTDP-4-dehydrorhamnose reductase [Saprospirales bacterium]HAW04023.1 dTDP-4-dehydrorhamnose reductase [Saprospirales bacterium]